MDEEIQVLQSIFLDDLTINQVNDRTIITITIYSHGEENEIDLDKRLLCITFIAELPATYPEHSSPKITLCQSRGLTDEQLTELKELIQSCLELNTGSCVLYECIESIRSKLSSYELPTEACAICLTMITDRNEIIRTNCHHFYHKDCLSSYVENKKLELEEKYNDAKKNGFSVEKDFRQDIEDPVCRQILSTTILEQLPPTNRTEHIDTKLHRELIQTLSPNIRQWQQQTQALFQQQKDKGGIIDLDRTQEIIFR